MASTSETGHHKNAASFEQLISFAIAYGVKYNPSRPALYLSALLTLKTNADSSISAVSDAKILFDNATNARQIEFEPLEKLSTRIVNAFDASEASPQMVKDLKFLNNKIQGKPAKGKPKPKTETETEAAEDKRISTSQQSFDSKIDFFDKIIKLIGTEPSFAPNETELQTSTLNTTLGKLRNVNSLVINQTSNYSNARITRQAILYAPVSGLIYIAADVKKYVLSVFGASSPQYKQIKGLEFKPIK